MQLALGIDELLDKRDDYILVEVAPDPVLYEYQHLPGALMLPLEALHAPRSRDVASRELLEERLGGLGISNEDGVVLYSDLGNRYAYYAFWILWCHGARNVHVLDGGKAGWYERGLPMEADARAALSTHFKLRDPDWSDRILIDELLARLEDPTLIIVDARYPEEYSGVTSAPPEHWCERSLMSGHIPGAVNIPWNEFYREGTNELRDSSEVRRLLSDAGIREDHEVVVYCRTGARASLAWFYLRHVLGFRRVRLYDGSWSEWGNAVGAPVER
ncbi:MAG: sulfurtransferase [Conexivisphaera sp.]